MNYLENLFSLSGKTALVTGGATGIGRMISEALVHTGATVLMTSRKGEVCDAAAAELNSGKAPGTAIGFGGDVSSESGISDIASEVKERVGKLDILVNNAGRTWGDDFERFPYAAWQNVLAVNLTGAFMLCQKLMPMLLANGTPDDPSRIINLGSVTGSRPIGNRAYSYATSKAAVHHLTQILAQEFAGRNVTVNAFAPGPFETKMMAHLTSDAEKKDKLVSGVPTKRLGRPADIAAATLFLCGRGGAYTTGAIIPIDGGRHTVTG